MISIIQCVPLFQNAHKNNFMIFSKKDAYQKQETLSNVHIENTIVIKLENASQFPTVVKVKIGIEL